MRDARDLDAVLVLGMHRSGTSVATGVLKRLGLYLGERLLPAAADNPMGYFEHSDAVAANEALLDALDRSWDDVRALPVDWLSSPAAATARSRIRDGILAELAAQAPWALKDPRLCRLLPLWRPLLEEVDVRAGALLVLRHPDEVAASLHARDRLAPTLARILWLRHVLEAARSSAEMPRAVLVYARLLEDPVQVLREVGERLGLPSLATFEAGVLAGFVRSEARHHVAGSKDAVHDDWHALACETYAALAMGDPAWAQVDALCARFQALLARHGEWIELTGATLRAADIRRRELAAQAVATEARLHQALETVTAQALERLETMRGLRAELDSAQLALARVEAQALERLETMQTLRAELDRTQLALARVETQALERLETMQTLRAELDRTQLALARVEALSLERLADVERLSRELDETLHARASAEAQLARIKGSWWWKAAVRVRRLLGRRG